MRVAALATVLIVAGVLVGACGDDTTTSTTATSNGGMGGGGAGVGGDLECLTAAECVATTNECASPSCIAGHCALAATSAGTPLASQVMGDCQLEVCDGAGNVQTQTDDNDIPTDQNGCTDDLCDAGMPVHPALPLGTQCSMGVCDGQGVCNECNSAADCPGMDDECNTRSCDAGLCSLDFTTVGTPVALQTNGDCQLLVCDGMGVTISVADDTDPPDDFNECTAQACLNGVPMTTVLTGQACGASGVCDASGNCVGCVMPTDCSGTDDFCKQRSCVNNVCGFTYTAANTSLPAGQQTTGNCQELVCDGSGNMVAIADNADLPVDGLQCTGDVCTNGAPSNPPVSAGTACNQNGGTVCNTTGQCVGCNVPGDCPSPGMPCQVATCSANTCGVGNAASGTVCMPVSCNAGVQQNADTCDNGGNCVDNGSISCSPYLGGPTSCTRSCINNAGCAAGFVCDTALGVCTNGPTCTDYCNIVQTNCTGVNQQYTSTASCIAACAALPQGTASDTSGNTIGCRSYHGTVAGSDPVTHCTHAGPGGAGVCGTNCTGFCDIAQDVCTGSNQQYATTAACLTECAGFPTATKYSTSVTTGDSYACRLYHLTQAAVDPNTHCGHIVETSPVCQ